MKDDRGLRGRCCNTQRALVVNNAMGRAIEGVPWDKIELAYKAGQGSCRELGEKFKVSTIAIQRRCNRGKWIQERAVIGQKVVERTIERVVDEKIERIKAHHSLVVPISEKLCKGVEKTYDDMNGQALEPSELQGLAMALKTANSVALLNLGFVPQSSVDVTSGGLSMHESALSILDSCRKLVQDGKASSKDIDIEALVLEAQQDSQSQNPK